MNLGFHSILENQTSLEYPVLSKTWESSYSFVSTQKIYEETFHDSVWDLKIQNFNFKVVNARVLILKEIKKSVLENRSTNRINSFESILLKQQQKQRSQDMKGMRGAQDRVWIRPYQCHVPLCLKSPRAESQPLSICWQGCSRLTESEQNSDINPAWHGSHKLGDRFTPQPHTEHTAHSLPLHREWRVQLQFYNLTAQNQTVTGAGWTLHGLTRADSTPSSLAHRLQPRKTWPREGKDRSLPEKSRVPGIWESPGQGTLESCCLKSSPAQTQRLQPVL